MNKLHEAALTISYRGPDDSQSFSLHNVYFDFFRLALCGLDRANGMPLIVDDCALIANAMIYNYDTLAKNNKFTMKTSNDCEVIIHAYRRWGIASTLDMLEGVFAFILYDMRTKTLYAARDPIGIRPLYYGSDRCGSLTFASEPIALAPVCDARIAYFPPGHYMSVRCCESSIVQTEMFRWWFPQKRCLNELDGNFGLGVFNLLVAAVQKRLLGERPVACLLSGGLDSSFVAALVSRELRERNPTQPLHTFSIGFPESPDLVAARQVAIHIHSYHHEIVVTEQQLLDHQREIVRITQSPDVTTNRASTAQSLLCKYIAEKTDFKIIFNGDCSEEIWASYKYSRFAPSDQAFLEDNWRLIDEVHMYDVLRSDRCIAHYGLDARTPFADRRLVEYVMMIPPHEKRHGVVNGQHKIEKFLMRRYAQQFLPENIAWRPKEAFSDGISRPERSWFTVIGEHYDKLIASDDPQFVVWASQSRIPTKEAYFYFCRFIELFGEQLPLVRKDILQLVPQYWMPRFVSVSDPSARIINNN